MIRIAPIHATLIAVASAVLVSSAHAKVGLVDSGAIWVAHPVLFPVSLDNAAPERDHLDAETVAVRGPVELASDRAALLWLDTLRVVRVRLESPDQDAGLEFGRVIGGQVRGAARALVEEPGVHVEPGIFYLIQPPGGGSMWYVTAKKTVRVHIEAIELPRGDVAWESIQRTILDWIDADDTELKLPPIAGVTEFRAQLHAERDFADAITNMAKEPAQIHRAAIAWRKASALRQLMPLRPFLWSQFRVTHLEHQLADTGPPIAFGEPRPYRRVDEYERTWRLELDGPGVLRIEARALLDENRLARQTDKLGLRVLVADQPLGQSSATPRPIRRTRVTDDSSPDDDESGETPDDDEPPPRDERYVLPGGEYLGTRQRLVVNLRPGRHTYTLEATGGPMALRVTHATRRPFARESLTESRHEGDHVERARRLLKGDASLPATLLRRLLAEIDGQTVDASDLMEAQTCVDMPAMACALLQVQLLRTGVRSDVLARVLRRARQSLRDVSWESAWRIRIIMAEYLSQSGRFTELRRLLRDAEDSPPSSAMARLAELLPPPVTDESSRSRPVALMDRAWRAAPLDPELRARYRTLWREESTWSRLSPEEHDRRRLREDVQIWLRRDDEALGQQGAWGRMPLGRSVRVLAPRADIDRSRPAVLRLVVVTDQCGAGLGPIAVSIHKVGNNDVDTATDANASADSSTQRTWSAIPMQPRERWEFAVAPGEYSITVDGPRECAEVYSSLPEVTRGGYVGAAWVERAWPPDIGSRPVRYELPDPHVQGPIQVRLRAALSDTTSRSGILYMRTDLGTTRRIEATFHRADDQALLFGDRSELSYTLSFVVSPPVGARHIWFESSGGLSLLASVFVRRPTEEPVRARTLPTTSVTPLAPLDALAEISANIDDRDPEASHLLRRADVLLDLGFPDLARRDAKRAAAGARDARDDGVRKAYRALLIRLDRVREPAHLPASSPAGEAHSPVPLWPADLALPGHATTDQIDALRRFREQPTRDIVNELDKSASARTPRARYLQARMLARLDHQLEAGRRLAHLAQDVDVWQVLRDSAIFLGLALESGKTDNGIAALTYGVARDLDDRGTVPMVRKVLFLASELSRWSAVRGADRTAGYQRLMIERDPNVENPRTRVNDAMVAAPWHRSSSPSQTFRPGRSAALQVKLLEATPLHADMWCRQVKLPRPGEVPTCRMSILVDGQPHASISNGVSYDNTPIEVGKVVRFSTGPLPPGVHRIEARLSEESRWHRAAVRFLSERQLPDSGQPISTDRGLLYPLPIKQPATAFMAGNGPNRSIELTVNGPTALYINTRSSVKDRAKELRIDVQGIKSTTRHRRQLPLRTERDPEAVLREGLQPSRELTAATSTVVPIPDDGPHRVTIAPDAGMVYVRVSLREDREEAEATELVSRDPESRPGDDIIRWPGVNPELALLEATYPHVSRSLGTTSVDATVRANELGENDELPQVIKLDVTASWRRQLLEDRMWIYLAALARTHFDGRFIFGARARIQDAHLPGGMRGFGELRIFTQMLESNLEWSAYGRFDIERPTRLAQDLTLIPRLSLRTGQMSISFDRIPSPGPEIDPAVYSVYRYFHRHAAIPRLSLRWRPFQDHVGNVDIAAVPNANLASLDRVEMTLRWNTLLHVTRRRSALAQLSYRPSYRYYDEDRFDAYVRHDLRARAEANLWTGRTGRLQAHAQATLYWSRLYGRSADFMIGLTYDLTRGRGLRDFFSFEEEFDPYVEGRLWTYDER